MIVSYSFFFVNVNFLSFFSSMSSSSFLVQLLRPCSLSGVSGHLQRLRVLRVGKETTHRSSLNDVMTACFRGFHEKFLEAGTGLLRPGDFPHIRERRSAPYVTTYVLFCVPYVFDCLSFGAICFCLF